jgi:multimeric flavodoxin WrbA
MAAQFLCLRGSPRQGGNSDQLADAFCSAAQAAGGSVQDYALRDIDFTPWGDPADGNPDALSPVLEKIFETDVLVLSTPIYFCNVSGLLKGVIDRFFSFLKPDYLTAAYPSRLPPGKSLVLLQTQGEPEVRYGGLLEQYGPALDKLGLADRYLVRACGVRESGDIAQRPEVLRKAAALAHKLNGATKHGA